MSLRWKLLRFLTAEPIIGADDHDSSSVEGPGLFVGLNPAPYAPTADTRKTDTPHSPPLENTDCQLLRQLAHAASRASSRYAAHGVYAFALPRGVVDVFALGEDLMPAVKSNIPGTLQPAHFTIVAHDSLVAAVYVISRIPPLSPMVVTAGLDGRIVSIKMWTFSEVPVGTIGSPSRFLQDSYLVRGDQTQILTCSATLRIQSESLPCAIAVLEGLDPASSLRCIAVGFEDGAVMALTGDLMRERFTNTRIPPAPGEMRDARAVTFLAFSGSSLMCVTEQSVAVIRPIFEPGQRLGAIFSAWSDARQPRKYVREVHDSRGSREATKVAFMPYTGEIVIAREEALYFFHADGRGPCLAFPSEGSNTCIATIGPYLIHSTRPKSLLAYDLASKVVAYRGNSDVQAIFADEARRTALVVMEDGSIVRLKEVPLEKRVQMLLNRGLHTSAISLAKIDSGLTADAPPSQMFTDAVREYSLFLMAKGDFDGAATQLISTIGGAVEPSWVITRLVEQPGLRSGLRSYLEALHLSGKAAFVHTRVLITCYRHDRARAAILRGEREESTTDKHIIQVLSDVNWSESEVDTAIDICCEAGLYRVAENVSRKRGRNVRLARTLVENLDDIEGGLGLMRSLTDRSEALEVAEISGRRFLARAPKDFVAIAADLIGDSPMIAGSTAIVNDSTYALSQFARLFVDRPQWLATLIESVLNKSSSAGSPRHGSAVWMLLFEALTRSDVDRGPRAPIGRSALKVLQSRTARIDLTKALRIAELYGHGPCLEYVYEHLRMYRELGQHLRWSGDVGGLMRACRRHGKREPYLWLEAVRLVAPLAREGNETDNGSQGQGFQDDTSLASESLTTSKDREELFLSFDRRLEALHAAMVGLDSSGILTPAEIIDTVCAACPDGKWEIVQQYFEQILGQLTSRAQEKEASVASLMAETRDKQVESARLGEAVIIQSGKCGVCEDELSLPAVHFFCGHSFHAPCIAPASTSPMLHVSRVDSLIEHGLLGSYGRESPSRSVVPDVMYDSHGLESGLWTEIECPRCAPELDAIVSMRNALEEKNTRHDDFFRSLRGDQRNGGYETVMGNLARSAFL